MVKSRTTAVHTPSIPQQLGGVLAEITVVRRLRAGQAVWVAMNYSQRQRRGKLSKDHMTFLTSFEKRIYMVYGAMPNTKNRKL